MCVIIINQGERSQFGLGHLPPGQVWPGLVSPG